MIIERLRMQNFKRFSDEEVLFPDGITGIIGNNGSGKSTIIEAVLFALYGIKSSGLDGDYITSSFVGSDDHTFVTLDFSVAGTAYSVRRKYKRGKSVRHEAQLLLGKNLLADGVSGVEREMTRIVGMGPADFRKTIYAAQKDLLSLIEMTPGERRDWFMRMLGIDFIKKESDLLLKEEIKGYEKTISAKEFYLSEHSPASIGEMIDNISKEEESVAARISAISAEKKSLDGEMAVQRELISGLMTKQEDHSRISGEIASLDGRIGSLKDTLLREEQEREELKSAEEEFGSLLDREKTYPGIKSDFTRLSELRQENSSLETRKNMLEKSVSSHSSILKNKNTDLAQIIEAEDICRRLKPLVDEREEVFRSHENMSALEREYISTENRLEQTRKRFRKLEGSVKTAREKISRLEKELAEGRPLREQETGLNECESGLSALNERLGSLDEKRSSFASELSSLEDKIAEVRATGPDGECPTCQRRLGDQYKLLIEDYTAKKAELEGALSTSAEEEDRLRKSAREMRSSMDSLRHALELDRQKHSLLLVMKEDLSALFGEVDECMNEETSVTNLLSSIAYSPEEIKRLRERLKELDGFAGQYIRAGEHAGMRSRVENECSEIGNRIDLQRKELEEVISSIGKLGYSEEEFLRTKEEYGKADLAHQRFLDLKPRMVTIPLIEKTIREIKEEISHTGRKIAALDKDLLTLAFSTEEFRSARSRLDALTEETGKAAALCSGLAAEARAMAQEREGLEAELGKTRKYQKDCLKLKEEISLLETTRRMIGEYTLYLMQMIREQIEAETARVISEITDGRYDQVIIDDDFNILVSDTGEFFPVRRFSGGEQDDIAVALRVALSRFLSRMFRAPESSFLIFDEIFGSQDEERRSNLVRALRTQESMFPQIFLISHVGDIQGEFSHTLLVEMENTESSKVVEVDL